MGVESKIKTRLIWCIVGVFVVLAILVGLLQALEITIGLFLIWKAYGWFKLHQFWQKESAQSKLTIEYVTKRLNEGAASNNLWIRYLTTPEGRDISSAYRVGLTAAAMLVEAKGGDPIEGWSYWASERIEECIETFYEGLTERVNVGRVPTTTFELITQQLELEFDVARHALSHLGVAHPSVKLDSAVDKCINTVYEVRAKKLITFIVEHVEVPSKNKSQWAQYLRQPANQEFAKQYRASLIEKARELRLDSLLTAHIKYWREWGATRIEEHVMDREDELSRDVAPGSSISSYDLMIERAAFEIVVAQEALRLLGVGNPEGKIATMCVRRSEHRSAVISGAKPPSLDYVAVDQGEFENELLWFMTCRLAEREKSTSLWVKALACDEMNTQEPSYQERVLASEKSEKPVGVSSSESWRLWGATRIEVNLLDVDENTLNNRAVLRNLNNPVMRDVLSARVAFEESVAEHALALLGIPDPSAVIKFFAAERGLKRATERAIRTLAEIREEQAQGIKY